MLKAMLNSPSAIPRLHQEKRRKKRILLLITFSSSSPSSVAALVGQNFKALGQIAMPLYPSNLSPCEFHLKVCYLPRDSYPHQSW